LMDSSWLALYVAYSIVWVGAFGFLIYLYLRQRRIDGDVKALKEALSKHGK
jgi:CcmD family protein